MQVMPLLIEFRELYEDTQNETGIMQYEMAEPSIGCGRNQEQTNMMDSKTLWIE
jgi:hypothetical protein